MLLLLLKVVMMMMRKLREMRMEVRMVHWHRRKCRFGCHRGRCSQDSTLGLQRLTEVQWTIQEWRHRMGTATTTTTTETVIVVHSFPISLGYQLSDWNVAARYRGHCTRPTGRWRNRLIEVELLPPGLLRPRFTCEGETNGLLIRGIYFIDDFCGKRIFTEVAVMHY